MGQPLVIGHPDQASASPGKAAAQALAAWPWDEALAAADLDLEDRSRVSALPWRGQFSPMTVERLLECLCPTDATVLDPFVGSGTALLEAARRGHPSIGLDVNPAAVALAQCAALAALDISDRQGRLDAAFAAVGEEGPGLPKRAATIQLAHALALLAQGSSLEATREKLDALLSDLPEHPVSTAVHLRDARATGLPDSCAGFALTSPPYINVFNYHQVGRPLSDAFGWPVLAAASSEIGSNRQNRSNRFKTVIQYSIDMGLVIAELSRVLQPGAGAVLVLGRVSRVRGIPFFNGDIAARILERIELFGRLSKGERRFVSRFGETIAEDLLVLKGNGAVSPHDREEQIGIGRAVGREALENAATTPETASEVLAAIEEAGDVVPSPIARPLLDLA